MTQPRPPLVLHVIHHLVIGGMENGLVNLINHTPQDRYSHACVCIEDFSSFRTRITRPDVEVIALHRARIGIWALRRRLFDLCRHLKPTIVHTRGLSGLDALLPAALAGVQHRVHGEHGWDVGDLHGTQLRTRMLRKLHAPLVSRYVAVSEHLDLYLRERIGIRPSRISQIHNGVDTVRFAPARRSLMATLPDSFRADGVVVIGTVGRLQAVKDQATLVRAFADLRRQHPHLGQRARLLLVGDGPMRSPLTELAHSFGLGDSVHFAGAQDDVPTVLGAMHVFALPSLNEGISNTVLEAMASGLPVIATAVGGNTELVEDRVVGRLFQPGDVAGLVGLLADYLANPALLAAHGSGARRVAVERFSLTTMVGRYLDLYDALIQNNRAQSVTALASSTQQDLSTRRSGT